MLKSCQHDKVFYILVKVVYLLSCLWLSGVTCF
jgi:hypothetical protein